ncbi:MAG: hypothetical protein IMZ53_14950 [Thermoplasmata archaeon]|nr:hypothetical protein [Thermoplasmata archaeon]
MLKEFVCWLSSPGKYHDVPLYIGDDVMVKLKKRFIRGKIGHKGRCYVVRCPRITVPVIMITRLMPV